MRVRCDDDRHILGLEEEVVLFAYGDGFGWTIGEDKASKDFAWADIVDWIADTIEDASEEEGGVWFPGPDDLLPWEAP